MALFLFQVACLLIGLCFIVIHLMYCWLAEKYDQFLIITELDDAPAETPTLPIKLEARNCEVKKGQKPDPICLIVYHF